MGAGAPEPDAADEHRIRRYMDGHDPNSWTYGVDGDTAVYYDTNDIHTPGQPWQDDYVSHAAGVRAVYADTGADAPLSVLATPGYEPGDYGRALRASNCGREGQSGEGTPREQDRCSVTPGDKNHPFRQIGYDGDRMVMLVPVIITAPGLNADGNYDSSVPRVERLLTAEEIVALGDHNELDNDEDINEVDEQVEVATEIGNDLHELSSTGTGDLVQDAPGAFTGNRPLGEIEQDDFAKRTRLKEQCFLLANVQEFATFNQRLDPHYWWAGVEDESKFRTKAITVLQGESNTLVNLLTGDSLQQFFFELTPDQQSLLVPTIRLFKVIDLPEGSDGTRLARARRADGSRGQPRGSMVQNPDREFGHNAMAPVLDGIPEAPETPESNTDSRMGPQEIPDPEPQPIPEPPVSTDSEPEPDAAPEGTSSPTEPRPGAGGSGGMGGMRGGDGSGAGVGSGTGGSGRLRRQIRSGDCQHAIEIPFYNIPAGDYMGLDSDGNLEMHPNPEKYYEISDFARGLAGIKSFSWDYVGNNPVSARTDINAKLVMHFQSFEDIIRERPAWALDENSEPMYYPFKYAELAMRSGSEEVEQRGSINPRGRSDPGEIDPDSRKPTHPYRLRAHLGWAVPPASPSDPAFTDDQRQAIKESFVTLYLTIIDHTFDINDDATVTFTVEYKAYIESNFGDPAAADILLTDEIARAREERADRLELAEESCDADTVKEVKKEHAKEIDIEKQEAYMSLINTLEGSAGWINGAGYDGGSLAGSIEKSCRQSRIYTLSIPFSEVDMFVNDGPFFYDGAQEWLTSQLSDNPPEGMCDSNRAGSRGPISDGRRDVVGEIEDRIEEAGGFSDGNDALEHLTMFSDADYDIAESDGPGQCTTMNWFYMGDLLHAALERLEQTCESTTQYGNRSKNQSEKLYKSRVVLGPIDLIDPITQQTFQVNLADIPISLNYFIDWFMQKVLAKQEARWPFMAFMREAINDLIIRVLNDSDYCFGGTVKQKAIFSTTYLMAKEVMDDDGDPGARDVLDVFERKMNGGFKGQDCERRNNDWEDSERGYHISRDVPNARIYSNKITKRNVERAGLSYPLLTTFIDDLQYKNQILCRDPYYKYVIVTAGSSWSSELRGDKEDDFDKGVFWFGIGSPRGPVKTVKFNKTDMKGVKEARFFREGFDGLSQLREPYDVDISLYGMPRIFPGTMCFVDPLALGANMGRPYNPDSMAFLLGFGGYHQITKVKNVIEPGKYQTDIHCKWVQSGWPDDPRRGRMIGQGDDNDCDEDIEEYLRTSDAWFEGPWADGTNDSELYQSERDFERNPVGADPD